MDENYWKGAYQGTWPAASKRENRLKAYLEKETGMQCIASGLGADLWRVIHVDEEFKKRFREYQFPVVTPAIRNLSERYVEIKADKINVGEIFKMLAPDTRVKVI